MSSTTDVESAIVNGVMAKLVATADRWHDWPKIEGLMKEEIRKRVAWPGSSPTRMVLEGADKLRQEGMLRLGQLLSTEQSAELVKIAENTPCYNSHTWVGSDGEARYVNRGAEKFHFGSFKPHDVLTMPYLLEVANNQTILDIVADYFGCCPTLFHANMWWSFGDPGTKAQHTQHYHRDPDDMQFCTLFIYLTDVDQGNGPHRFVKGTHRRDYIERVLNAARNMNWGNLDQQLKALSTEQMFKDDGHSLSHLIDALFADTVETITGTAGTGILANTYAFHMGVPLEPNRRRLIFWARYGLFRNQSCLSNFAAPIAAEKVKGRIPNTPLAKYVNRVLIEP